MRADAIRPLEPNPGGVVDPDDLVDREAELDALLRHVAQGGAYIVGDRRMGKTSLIKKAVAQLREVGHTVVYVSAETGGLDTFTTTLLAEIRQQAQLGKGLARWEAQLSGEAGLKIAGTGLSLSGTLKRTHKPVETDLLRLCVEAIRARGPHRLVLFIDEIAVLANALQAREATGGMEFLRALRRSRQSIDGVSVVLAGSVGLHHAITDLSVINDLPEIAVGPLPHADGVLLARRLLLGSFATDSPELAESIARSCSDIPYYIQALVNRLRTVGLPTDAAGIEAAVEEALASDLWDTDHYYDRIARYYGPDEDLVVAAMDALADGSTMSLNALVADVTAANPLRRVERARWGEVLRRMQRDHYVVATPGGYHVASDLLARCWRAIRERR